MIAMVVDDRTTVGDAIGIVDSYYQLSTISGKLLNFHVEVSS